MYMIFIHKDYAYSRVVVSYLYDILLFTTLYWLLRNSMDILCKHCSLGHDKHILQYEHEMNWIGLEWNDDKL